MRKRVIVAVAAVLLVGLLGRAAYAQCRQDRPEIALGPPSVLIIMDASKSMAKDAGDGRTRLAAAKEALRTLVRELPDDARVGLRLYGHRVADTTKEEGCQDTELVAPVAPLDREALLDTIESYDAVGFTPIGRALTAGVRDLPPEGRNSIVLVSDGGDNCAPPGPCSVAEELAEGGTSVSIQAIGFQVAPRARRQLECIAERGGGVYRDADDADELAVALRALAARGLRSYRPHGAEISGGPGAAQATPVRPGQYQDAIGPGQERWYRIDLAVGQRLAASAALIAPCPVKGALASVFEISFADRRGAPIVPPGGDAATSLFFKNDLSVESVGILGAEVDDRRRDFEPFSRPGPYLIRVRLKDGGNDLAEQLDGELAPVELLVDVAGDPAPAPGRPAQAASTDGGVPIGVVVAVAMALGAAAGAMAAARWRRHA